MAATAAIQIGELSRRTSCNIETIRYYERAAARSAAAGPLPQLRSGGRGSPGLRAPCEELGFTLDEVRALLGLAAGGQASCTEVRELAASHLQDVRARIADLRRMERVLADSVRACDAGQDPGCPLLDALGAEVRAA
jgi:MerR family mercuric resistance operon transcriptional regulator